MKSDNTIRNGTSIFVGIIVAIAVRARCVTAAASACCLLRLGAVCAAPSARQPPGDPQEERKGSPPRQVCGAGHRGRTAQRHSTASCEPTRHRCTSYGGQQHHMGMGHERSTCHRQGGWALPDPCSRTGRL